MTHWLSSLANGRLVLTLEGGYNVNSISQAMTMCTKALLRDPLVAPEPHQQPCPSAVASIANCLETHRRYWPNLVFQKALPQEQILPKAKVPRAKPTERLSSEYQPQQGLVDFSKLPLNGRAAEPPESSQRQRDTSISTEQLVAGLEGLAIRECVNPGKKKGAAGFEGSRQQQEDSAGSSSGESMDRPGSSSQASARGNTLLDYLQDNLQVGLVS